MRWNGNKIFTFKFFIIWASSCIEKVESVLTTKDFEKVSYL